MHNSLWLMALKHEWFCSKKLIALPQISYIKNLQSVRKFLVVLNISFSAQKKSMWEAHLSSLAMRFVVQSSFISHPDQPAPMFLLKAFSRTLSPPTAPRLNTRLPFVSYVGSSA